MAIFLLTLLIMLLIVLGMSLGVLAGRGPLKGSCGGMSALGLNTECEICGGDPGKCDRPSTRQPNEALKVGGGEVYDAMKTGPVRGPRSPTSSRRGSRGRESAPENR